MEKVKAWICLDIDGTTTSDPHSIPQQVLEYFTSLYEKGYRFVFITGRTFAFANATLSKIPFPFLFSVQNGADLLQMPEKIPLQQHYLPASVIERLDEIYEGREEDYIIYSGWQAGDFCYYRPARFSEWMTSYLEMMMTLVEEPWQALHSFGPLRDKSFPLIKCLGTKEHMKEVEKYLHQIPEINVTCIKDPLSKEGYYLNLITDKNASKGNALNYIRTLAEPGALFIGAGDDRNDISLLESADIAIAMQNAPDDLIKLADIIAPPASEMGIIKALGAAILLGGRNAL
ncbi:MAG: HAD family hydrolase [Chlamydiae bacterium]|nr:HAD family hydrolase [Chlamydiota bacterium]